MSNQSAMDIYRAVYNHIQCYKQASMRKEFVTKNQNEKVAFDPMKILGMGPSEGEATEVLRRIGEYFPKRGASPFENVKNNVDKLEALQKVVDTRSALHKAAPWLGGLGLAGGAFGLGKLHESYANKNDEIESGISGLGLGLLYPALASSLRGEPSAFGTLASKSKNKNIASDPSISDFSSI